MKKLRNLAFLATALLPVIPSAQAQVASPQSGEYWIDQQFDQRKSITIANGWQTELDVSALGEGMHSISFRASDTRGRWSSPITRYFLRAVPSHEGNLPTVYEYWTDGNFGKRTAGLLAEGRADLQIDGSALMPGMHVFNLRTGDSHGNWSAPLTRYFLVPEPAFADNAPAGYQYWIDGAHDRAVSGVVGETGTIDLQLDLSHLCKGLHTLCYQVSDQSGRRGAPVVKYFVVPDLLPADNKMTAYEYWFNAGPRVRVEVEPENPLTLNDLVIEIKDVVPNEIPADYRFDASTETVYCADNVFFGMSACDLAGHSSPAVLSDTFPMTVPVHPAFADLTEGTAVTFEAPGPGHIRGFRMGATTGDSIAWTLSGACTADFYDGNGTRLPAKTKTDADGNTMYEMKTATDRTYALLHHAPAVVRGMDITCRRLQTTGMAATMWGCTFRTAKNSLTVDAPHRGTLRIVSAAGRTVADEEISAGTTRLYLPAGIYLLQWESEGARKILIP